MQGSPVASFWSDSKYDICPEKIQPFLIKQEWFVLHWCNLAAKERGLEWACVNNRDFTVPVCGGSRCHWVSMIQEATAVGNCWLAASSQHRARSRITSHAEFFGKTSNHSGDSAPYSPDLIPWDFYVFPETSITFEKEEISGHPWDSGKYDRAADSKWENCVRS